MGRHQARLPKGTLLVENDSRLDPLLGTVVHNYVVRKRLAEGGMGAVYLADHCDARSASKKVIKILLPEYSQHPVLRERFEQEALAVMRLKHPYIVEIDNFGTLPDGQLYLMMEFLDGETLEAHLQRRGRCDLHHSLHIIAQVMSALLSMHEAGLVHRDLKPANIFLLSTEQNPYEVRLIDLGIARNLAAPNTQNRTVTGMAMGTPGYMAVEQYEDAASATPAADVYAAAVIVWRMLMGQAPWGEVFDERVLYFKQRTEQFEPPAGHDVPPEVVSILRRALSKESTERPSVADFVNLLASRTPAIPPFVPSGAMILNDVAKRFIKYASVNDKTVRNVSHAAVATPPMSWPHRGTQLPHLVGAAPTLAAPPAPTPVSAPTANERHGAQLAPRPTTLSGSSGVINVPSVPPPHRRTRALLLGGACVAVAVAAFAVVQVTRGSSGETRPSTIEPAATPSATAPNTAASPSASVPSSPPPPSAVGGPTTPAPAQTATTAPPADPSLAPHAGVTDPALVQASPTDARASSPPTKDASSTRRRAGPGRRDASGSAGASVPARSQRSDPKAKTIQNEPGVTIPPRGAGSGSAAPAHADRFDPNAIVE